MRVQRREADQNVDSTTAYVYNSEGNRVRKLGGESTRFIHGIGDEGRFTVGLR